MMTVVVTKVVKVLVIVAVVAMTVGETTLVTFIIVAVSELSAN